MHKQGNNFLKIYLINQRSDRLKFQEKQFRSLHLNFHRFEVIPFKGDDTYLPFPVERKLYWRDGNTFFPSPAELSCFASHVNIWAEIESSQPAIILEDDAIIAPCFRQLTKKLSTLENIDYINLETSPNPRYLLPRVHQKCSNLQKLAVNSYHSAGYVLWPSGARKLLRAARLRPNTVDQLIWECMTLKSFQLIPAQVIQLQFVPNRKTQNIRLSTIERPLETPPRTIAMEWRRLKCRMSRSIRKKQSTILGGRIEVVSYWDGTLPYWDRTISEKKVLNSSHG